MISADVDEKLKQHLQLHPAAGVGLAPWQRPVTQRVQVASFTIGTPGKALDDDLGSIRLWTTKLRTEGISYGIVGERSASFNMQRDCYKW